MSRLVSTMARSWSGVSVKGNDASNSRCHSVSGGRRSPAGPRASPGPAEQLGGEVERGALGGGARLLPAAAADAAELRPGLGQADIAADEVRLLQRDVQRHLVVEFQRDDLADARGGVELGEAAIDGDAVLEVDDEVALHQFREVEQLVDLGARAVSRKPSFRFPRRNRGSMRESPGCSARISRMRRSSPSLDAAMATRKPSRLQAATCPRNALRASSSAWRRSRASRLSDGEAAVVFQALGVPDRLRCRLREDRARLVDLGEAEGRGALGEQGRERVRAVRSERPELLLERGRLHEGEVGAWVQVVRDPRLGRLEPHPRGRRDRDPLDPRARALRDRVKRPDVLDVVTEEVEPVGLGCRDGIDVDNPPAHGVMSGRLAHGLAVVVQAAQPLEELLERLPRAAREDDLARGVLLDGRHRLQERRRRREHGEDPPGADGGPRLAQLGKHGQPVARSGERLAHVAAVGHRLREHEGLERTAGLLRAPEERGVFGELLRGPEVGGHHHPDGRWRGPHRLGEDGSAGRRAHADDLVPCGSGHLEGGSAARAARAARAASSSATFFEGPRPEPILRPRRQTATSYLRSWSAPSVASTS
jgi:hypothetical protein